MFENPSYYMSGDIRLAVHHAGPATSATEKPAVVFMHGFPELARSFRHQMQTLSAEGYPVFAPDMRGYAASEKPEGKEHYGMASLTGDMVALLDHFQIEKAVFVGHDLGAFVLWALPFYAKERVLGCAALNYPLMQRLPINPLWGLRLLFHRKMYMLQFQKEGRCERLLEADVARTMRFFMRRVDPERLDEIDMSFKGKALNIMETLAGPEEDWFGTPLFGDEELEIYVDTFKKGGFTAPIHWYRNLKANWKDMKQFLVNGKLPYVDMPCLMVTSDKDFACPPGLSKGMEKLCGPLTRVNLKGCSHWVHMERPQEVTSALSSWLKESF